MLHEISDIEQIERHYTHIEEGDYAGPLTRHSIRFGFRGRFYRWFPEGFLEILSDGEHAGHHGGIYFWRIAWARKGDDPATRCVWHPSDRPERPLTDDEHALADLVESGELMSLVDKPAPETENVTVEPYQKGDDGYTIRVPKEE